MNTRLACLPLSIAVLIGIGLLVWVVSIGGIQVVGPSPTTTVLPAPITPTVGVGQVASLTGRLEFVLVDLWGPGTNPPDYEPVQYFLDDGKGNYTKLVPKVPISGLLQTKWVMVTGKYVQITPPVFEVQTIQEIAPPAEYSTPAK